MNKKSSKGFTLVEIAIVLGVVGILVAVLVPSFISILAKSKENNRLERVTTARDAIFYEDPELATQSDMRGYLFKIEDSIYEVSNTGELVLSDYDLDEYDIEDYEKVTTKDNISGVEIFKPSAVTAFNRALRARNHYHSKHGLMTKTNGGNTENVFYEMSNFVIIVYDNDVQADVGYEVTYTDGVDGNGKLIPTDKTVESLREQGLEYTVCNCSECSGPKDTWQGIVYKPTDLTLVYLRVLALEEKISSSATIDWDDGNIKNSNFVYEVDGEMYCIDADNKVYRCESDKIEDIQDEGYTSLCQDSIANLGSLVIEANRNKKAYKTVNCYAVRYGYYDSSSVYHTWTEFKGIYNGGNEITTIAYKDSMSSYDIRKLILSDTVTKIGDKTFTNYTKLVDVVIPESVEEIEVTSKNPFANGKIATVRVNNKNINFYDYKNQSIIETETQKLVKGSDSLLDQNDKLPEEIKEIGNYAFEGSDVVSVDLTRFTVSDTRTYVKVVDKLDHMGNPVYKTDEFGNFVYETNPETGKPEKVIEQEEKTITEQIQVNKFGKGIFKDCELLSRVITSEAMTEIPEEMFSGCVTLSDYETREYLEVIKSKAFEGCVALTRMDVFMSLREIGANAFDGCNDTLIMYYEDSRKTFEAISGAHNAIDNIKELVCELKDIEYNLNGGELPKGTLGNPVKFDPDVNETLSLIAPEREGAIFRSWSVVATYYPQITFADIVDSGSLIQPYQFITDKYNGYDVTLTANYERVVFNINYEINNEDVTAKLDDEYKKTYNKTLNTEIYLPKYEKDYYEFDGWYCDAVHLGEYLMQSDYAKDLVLTATYNPAKYTITYDYNGGQVDDPTTDEIEANPSTYTIEDEDYTLLQPTRDDYTFSSWTKIAYRYDKNGQIVYVTSTDGEITQSITLEKGAIPYHLSLKANYVATEYDLSYQESDGTPIFDSGNPTKFTILSGTYELNAPSDVRGYDFVGWKVGNEELEDNKFICGQYHGETVVTAVRKPWVFTITYTNRNDNGVTGDYVTDYENGTTYNFGSTVKLNLPTMKTGYKFVEWIDDNGRGNVILDPESGNYYITGGESNLRICAKWEIMNYTITYDRKGGIDVMPNRTDYDVEEDPFVINDVEKLGYTFIGWTGDGITEPQKNILIDCQSTFGDKVFEAHYEIIHYAITYSGLTGATVYGNPESYTVETEFSLNAPTKAGYTFLGWTGTNCNMAMVVQVTRGNVGERNYHANFEVIPYTIVYYLDGGTNHLDNPNGYNVESETFAIKQPTRLGYTFLGWTGDGLATQTLDFNIEKGSIGDRTYTAHWVEDIYNITYKYVLDDGEAQVDTAPINKTTYTIADIFTLTEPTRIGYKFNGWEGTGLFGRVNSVEISGETGDREYTSFWTAEEYTIKYDYRGGSIVGENITLYSIATPTFEVINPTKVGYTFLGWTEQDESVTPVKILKITQGVTSGNKEFIAQWDAIDYTITLDYVKNNKKEIIDFNIESAPIDIPEAQERGYEFLGWTSQNGTLPEKYGEKTFTIVINEEMLGNKLYSADWALIEYTIVYNLNGGTLPEGKVNPVVYTVESSAFTLVNPEKRGYTFTGWTGTDLAEKAMTVTIDPSTVDLKHRSYDANYEIKVYTISYTSSVSGCTYNGSSTNPNPTTFTVITPTFSLVNPVAMGYIFRGWSGYDIPEEAPSTTVTIIQGSIDDRVYKQHWELINYTITYVIHDNSTLTGKIETYNVTTPAFTLPNPSMLYYGFLGWTDETVTTPTTEYTISPGTRIGNITVYSNDINKHWELLRYTITYDYYYNESIAEDKKIYIKDPDPSDGVDPEVSLNPYEYYSYDETFTLTNPERNGHDFLGWSGTGINGLSKTVTITKGSKENKHYNANWAVLTYTISYDLNGFSLPAGKTNPTSYTIYSENIEIVDPAARTGYHWAGWTGSNGTEPGYPVIIVQGSYGDKEYKANGNAKQYSVGLKEYDANGTKYITATYDQYLPYPVVTLAIPTKTGYTFSGYYFEGVQYLDKNMKGVLLWQRDTESETLLEKYMTPNPYTITFDKQGGTGGTSSATVYYDGALPSATAPSKTYYNFMGYFTATNGGGTKYYTNTMAANVGSYTTAGNLTLYADWDPIKYSITYNLNGGTNHSSNPAEYTIESGDITIYAASKSGSIWDGWSGTGLSGKHQSFKIPSGSTGNRTYTANFSAPIGPTGDSITSKVGGGTYSDGCPNLATLTWSRKYDKSTQTSTIYYTLRIADRNSRGQDTGTSWHYVINRKVIINGVTFGPYDNTLKGQTSTSRGPVKGSIIMSNEQNTSSWPGTRGDNVPGLNDGAGTVTVKHPNGGVAKFSIEFHVRFNYGKYHGCDKCSIGTASYEIGPMP